ncbi:MAG: Aromatic ring-hydroxylating dioxygenase subunit alpha [Thermoleophilia bacterium]|nr:Aromatic ring-hydroxylating dioxygenase subunit alpha [Thermoleophilia bacterium]
METAEKNSIAPFEHALEDGWTLPASWYSDEHVFALERERIFAAAWHYAGPAEWVADRGCFFAAQVGHVPIAVVRGADGTLRGFVNVCRHRGHLVLSGEGCRETLQCPYHAWTYGLDGTLRKAPRSEREPGFDPAGFSLLPVSVGAWGPFVFVNPDPGAAPLDEVLGELPSIVAGSGIDLETVRFHSHHEWPIEANWKVAMENFLECYHCPTAHPGFSKVIDVAPDAYRLQVHPTFSSQVGSVRESALAGNGKAAYRPRNDVAQAQYHFLFPVTTVNIAPGIPNIGLERYVPDGPARTIEVTDYYFGPDASIEEIEELMAWDSQVGEEDVSLVQSVQRGLESRVVPQGRLMAESEQLIADFQRRVRDALLA